MSQKQYLGIVGIVIFAGIAGVGYYFTNGRSFQITPPDPSSVTASAGASASASVSPEPAASSLPQKTIISYMEAPEYIGRMETVTGIPVRVYTSKKGTTFFDYCDSTAVCPFSAVLFSTNSNASKSTKSSFKPSEYAGKSVKITGVIKSYQGQAEIVIDDPSQISD